MANEPDSGATPVKPTTKKLLYKSPLTGIRGAPYKPPADKSGFKPIGVSSPILENDSEGDRFALVEGQQQGKPRPPNSENQRTPNHGVDSKPIPVVDSSVIAPSLVGRGGHWRGPQGNDMTPETRRGGRRHGYNSSPASEGTGQWYSPVQNANDCSNDSFGRKSFQHNNFRKNSSFGSSNSHTPNSPRQFNSSDRSRNSSRSSRRGGSSRGGNHGHRASGDISLFYSSQMIVDPWLDLIRQKMNASSFQSKSVDQDTKSILNVKLTSDSELDEGIASQESETPAVGDFT